MSECFLIYVDHIYSNHYDLVLFTCFTLAAIHNVRGDVTLFAMKLLTLRENDRIPERRTTCGAGPVANSFHLPTISPTSPSVIKTKNNKNKEEK